MKLAPKTITMLYELLDTKVPTEEDRKIILKAIEEDDIETIDNITDEILAR